MSASTRSSDTAAARHAEAIADRGYTIIEDAIPEDLRQQLLETIDRLMVELGIEFGANHFLGERTRRIFNLLSRDPLFQAVPLLSPVLTVVESVLDDGALLSSLTAIEMHPGQHAQPLHADDGSIPLPRPHQTLACPAIWALTDFTEENGATRLIPGSHRRPRIPGRGEPDDDAVLATMDAGSVLVYDGAVWHGGGANESDARRVGIVNNYCAGWVRTEECQLLALDRDQVTACPPRLRRMLGYGVYRGLIGHVDQEDPGNWFGEQSETSMVWESMR